jgi:hypothetical protein
VFEDAGVKICLKTQYYVQRLHTYIFEPDKFVECVLESTGQVAVMFYLETLKRLTKRLSDHNGFSTLTLTWDENPLGLPQIPRSFHEHIHGSWRSYRGCLKVQKQLCPLSLVLALWCLLRFQ